MYKLLLCWRYLRTRYIALASIISVTLGVATMIVVNAVMAGFSHEMEARMNEVMSDVSFSYNSLSGFYDPDAHMKKIAEIAGDEIEVMTPTVSVPGMLSFKYGGQWMTNQVMVIGIPEDAKAYAAEFEHYLQHPKNREDFSFTLYEDGYDVIDHQSGDTEHPRTDMEYAGWHYRVWKAKRDKEIAELEAASKPKVIDGTSDTKQEPTGPVNPFAVDRPTFSEPEENVFDPAKEVHAGAVVGFALASFRDGSGMDRFGLLPGDDIQLTLPTSAVPPRPIDASFTVTDLYESKMHEYDSKCIFVPLKRMQELRGMIEPSTGVGYVTAIQIKLKDKNKATEVRNRLRVAFEGMPYRILTWRDQQGPLLAAVDVETTILNILLFFIIAVAGFGILAIFYMVVVEKTKDIGVLKSLGASRRGVMGIFLGYGLSLGAVGSGVGAIIGLVFVWNINAIADLMKKATGQEVFDPEIYYFYKIPTIVNPLTILWIVVGAMLIAVLASVMPARRAASLNPVEALRYE